MTSAAPLRRSDLAIVRGAVAADRCASWLGLVETAIQRAHDTSSLPSLLLQDVPGLDVAAVWSSLDPRVQTRCASMLHGRVAVDLDQCWVRQQQAPSCGPAHRPHSWHQDGALRFDFLAAGTAAPPADALLQMVTCWIAITPCGIEAPGLELVAAPMDEMLRPGELREAVVDARWADSMRQRPSMAPGDAAVFTGDVLHRTHVTPAMTVGRISLELRCFAADALPARLRGDRFLIVGEITPAAGAVRTG